MRASITAAVLCLLLACPALLLAEPRVVPDEEYEKLTRDAALVVLSWRWTQNESGYVEVVGEVRNASGIPLANVKAEVRIWNQAGELIETDWSYLRTSPLAPGVASAFKILPGRVRGASSAAIEFSRDRQKLLWYQDGLMPESEAIRIRAERAKAKARAEREQALQIEREEAARRRYEEHAAEDRKRRLKEREKNEREARVRKEREAAAWLAAYSESIGPVKDAAAALVQAKRLRMSKELLWRCKGLDDALNDYRDAGVGAPRFSGPLSSAYRRWLQGLESSLIPCKERRAVAFDSSFVEAMRHYSKFKRQLEIAFEEQ